MNYSLKLRKLQSPMGSLAGFCDLVIDDTLVIKDFKIFLSKAGEPFAKPPSQLSSKVDDNGQKVWWPTVYFIDPKEFEDAKQTTMEAEILNAIVKEYLGSSTAPTSAPAAPETTSRPTAKTTAKRSNPWT
jgi:hypothetical protein